MEGQDEVDSGAKKHQPGRDHDRKSAAQRKRRFMQKALAKRQQLKSDHEQRIEKWNGLTPEQQKLLPELNPDNK